MFKFKLIMFLFLWAYSISSYSAGDQDFDEVCRIYTEANNSNMSIEAASLYIFDNVKKRVNSVDVLQAHEAVMHAFGNDRYALFKGSAEHVLVRNWDCAAMKFMMGMSIK